MSKNLGRIAYVLALAGLKKGNGGSENPGTSESVWEYVQKNSIFTNGSEQDFQQAWKKSLELQTFPEYLLSIGYTGDINQANTYILQLINGEIKSGGEDFYSTMTKLGFTNQTEINTVMINLLNGTLTMKEFYMNLQSLGYAEDFKTMQDRLYELFTSIFATENFVNTQINTVNTRIDNEVNTLNTSINEVNQDLQDHITEDNKVHEKLQINIDNVNTNLTNTINTLEQKHDKDITDINNKITSEINTVNDNITSLDNKLQQHVEEADNKFTNIDSSLEGHEKRITALENGEIAGGVTPWTYFVELTKIPNTTENKAKFDQNYINMGNGDTVYAYAEELYPGLSKNDFNVIMLDLVMGRFYNVSIYDQLKIWGFEGTEGQAAEWILKLVRGELGDGVDPYNYMKTSFPDYDATREEFNAQYGALMMLYLNGGASGGNAAGDGMWNDKYDTGIPVIPDTPNSKSLYQMYKDIGYPGTEKELYTQLVLIAQTLFSDGGLATNNTDPGNNDFSGYLPEPGPVSLDTSLYKLYQKAGLDKSTINENEFNKKVVDTVQNTNIPYSIQGGDAENTIYVDEVTEYPGLPDVGPIDFYPTNISGGNSTGTEWGGNIFAGDNPDNGIEPLFFTYLKSQGYKYDIETLASQIIELTNVNTDVSVDGGNSEGNDALNEYSKNINKDVDEKSMSLVVDSLKQAGIIK